MIPDSVFKQAKIAKIQNELSKKSALKAPDKPLSWLAAIFPGIFSKPFARFHEDMFEWAWNIELEKSSPPFVSILSRGFGKSTCAESVTIMLGAMKKRSYCLYVSATQDLADQHVASIKDMAETPIMSSYYPIFAKPKLSKEGHYRSWRRNRLAFGNGFTVDSVGLDSAKRGSKMMDKRPDLIILDDIDEKGDSPSITQKKIDAIFTSLLPAGSKDLTILAVQNMIIDTGIFSRLSQDDPPFLKNRILSGPYPALQNFTWNYKKDSTGKTLIEVSGEPTWQGFTLDNIQEIVNNIGITAFQSEYQHLIVDESSMFNGIKFQRVPQSQVPELFYKVVSLDPAVTSSDGSDSHGISVMGVSDKGNYYILESWEKRATPELALRKALYFCIKYNVTLLQVESNQGGELWYNLWDNIVSDTGMSNDDRMPGIEIVRASASTGGKMERASQMLIDYELNKVFHVENDSTEDLEVALMRFPTRKPFDLVDATYWSWQACSNASRWVL